MGFEYSEYEDFGRSLAAKEGEGRANKLLSEARIRSEALALKLLAARECPADIVEWGQRHNIPTFAEYTWQAGFRAGMRAAELNKVCDASIFTR